MGERSRWVTAQWRRIDAAIWDGSMTRFGPLPARKPDPTQARERSLWEAQAYASIARRADQSRRDAARQARRHGATWEQIAAALGISRQAASKLIARSAPSAGDGWMIDHKAS